MILEILKLIGLIGLGTIIVVLGVILYAANEAKKIDPYMTASGYRRDPTKPSWPNFRKDREQNEPKGKIHRFFK